MPYIPVWKQKKYGFTIFKCVLLLLFYKFNFFTCACIFTCMLSCRLNNFLLKNLTTYHSIIELIILLGNIFRKCIV